MNNTNTNQSFVKNLITDILNKKLTKYEAIKLIDLNVNNITKVYFIEEFVNEYRYVSQDFNLSFSELEISKILSLEKDNLPILRVNENVFRHIKIFIKEINGLKCVINVSGFKSIDKNSTEIVYSELIYLDELFLNVYDDLVFFSQINEKQNFKGITTLNEVYHYLVDISNSKEEKPTKEEKFKSRIWFKVGLLFATGEIHTLHHQYNQNFTHIAENKFKANANPLSFRIYISESYNNNPKSDKNIFNNQRKLIKISNHCTQNNIPMVKTFTDLIE